MVAMATRDQPRAHESARFVPSGYPVFDLIHMMFADSSD